MLITRQATSSSPRYPPGSAARFMCIRSVRTARTYSTIGALLLVTLAVGELNGLVSVSLVEAPGPRTYLERVLVDRLWEHKVGMSQQFGAYTSTSYRYYLDSGDTRDVAATVIWYDKVHRSARELLQR